MSKLGWKLAEREESLWSNLLRIKYFRNGDFFKCEAKQGCIPTRKRGTKDITRAISYFEITVDEFERLSVLDKHIMDRTETVSMLTPYSAELKALEWASEIVERKSFPRVFWFCDSQMAVKDSNEPNSWFAYNEILNVRHAFAGKRWSLFWISRRRNMLADLIAKTTLYNLSAFNFEVCCRDPIPTGNKSKVWKPPTNRWLKINIDAAFKDNSAAAAMDVRDSTGTPLFLATQLFSCLSSYNVDAKILALNWASTHAKECNWKNIIWVTDAKEVANTVLEASTPANWNSWYEIQSLKERFLCEDWILEWNNREANCLADLEAKYTLQHKTLLRCDEFSLNLLPKCITDRIQLERLASAV
ncbi:hypothetical protein FNV43_RR21039 [Rhamnella rubrinervis]|uniref:RNase H type-1 domain-containing protein n=1 Tax=Rhamnella rubrinervis TaxID=2594499 RepID=A0A8K0DZY6_9ROSA|nr:hypothetical protein FNV43_RR21039 [Rhamnella rubrinervis]